MEYRLLVDLPCLDLAVYVSRLWLYKLHSVLLAHDLGDAASRC